MSPDLLIAMAQAVLSALALLLLLDPRTRVRRAVSASTASALVAVSTGLFMLSAPISGVSTAICAAAWFGIFTIRGRDPNLSR